MKLDIQKFASISVNLGKPTVTSASGSSAAHLRNILQNYFTFYLSASISDTPTQTGNRVLDFQLVAVNGGASVTLQLGQGTIAFDESGVTTTKNFSLASRPYSSSGVQLYANNITVRSVLTIAITVIIPQLTFVLTGDGSMCKCSVATRSVTIGLPTLPLSLNNGVIKKINYNGTNIEHVYYNGTQLF